RAARRGGQEAFTSGLAATTVVYSGQVWSRACLRGEDMQLGKDIAAVVTGGASGLGAATARSLAAKGVKVAILDLNAEAGEKVAKELGGVFAKCDVTNENSASEALAAARTAHGQERILVNCAGIGVAKRISRR